MEKYMIIDIEKRIEEGKEEAEDCKNNIEKVKREIKDFIDELKERCRKGYEEFEKFLELVAEIKKIQVLSIASWKAPEYSLLIPRRRAELTTDGTVSISDGKVKITVFIPDEDIHYFLCGLADHLEEKYK
ncbi:MAG: hypothetical protein B6D55_05030 [Candidatus Omnitrophica bacterium 4484_70.2]|nr:MAG: hypothetical protein B6D55_05030 [Candidatus Omnitrophica bacterium 4484_70.2]